MGILTAFHRCKLKPVFSCTLADVGCPNYRTRHGTPWGSHESGYCKGAQMILLQCPVCLRKVAHGSTGDGSINTDDQHFWLSLIEKARDAAAEREIKKLQDRLDPDFNRIQALDAENTDLKKQLAAALAQNTALRQSLHQSQRNDPLWDVLPKKVKAELAKKYGAKAGVTVRDVV